MDILDRPSGGDVDCFYAPWRAIELSEIKPDGEGLFAKR
jgi:hypothetical protein